jgi:hypothetical protein
MTKKSPEYHLPVFSGIAKLPIAERYSATVKAKCMQNEISSIWHHLPPDLVYRTVHCVNRGSERIWNNSYGRIFFRADDVAAPGRKLARLMDIFQRHRVPLCLAMVPAWLTGSRWQYLKNLGDRDSSLWCWHQHGWRHVNHEWAGKKQEFGLSRSRSEIKRDLLRGRRRLEDIMGQTFYPVFTPPWNRCSLIALKSLRELGYAAVSRTCGGRPATPEDLPDFCVNVDLHTRKERDPVEGWNNLLDELQQAVASEWCGIMIHHQRMNDAAFEFIDVLLEALLRRKNLELIHFRHLEAL